MTDENQTKETATETKTHADSQTGNGNKITGLIADITKDAKGYSPLTFTCIGLVIMFLLFCLINIIAVRWWIMTPMAIAGIIIAYRQKSKASGTEKLVCTAAVWTLLSLFIVRDIVMASNLAGYLDRSLLRSLSDASDVSDGDTIGDFFDFMNKNF